MLRKKDHVMLGRFRPSLRTSGPASPAADPESIDLPTARVWTVRCATPSLSLLPESGDITGRDHWVDGGLRM